jgi:hypothetical protein
MSLLNQRFLALLYVKDNIKLVSFSNNYTEPKGKNVRLNFLTVSHKLTEIFSCFLIIDRSKTDTYGIKTHKVVT